MIIFISELVRSVLLIASSDIVHLNAECLTLVASGVGTGYKNDAVTVLDCGFDKRNILLS